MALNYRVIVERYPIPNGVVGGSIPIVKFSFSLTKKLARWVGSQELTHCKIDGKYHIEPRGFLSRVGPMDSNSRRIAQHWLVVYLRINWGGSMTISYPNQSHTNLSRSSTYNDQDINSRSMFYNKIIKNNLKKKLPMSQKDCLVICTTRNWGSKSNISTPNLLYQEVFRQHNFQGCFKVVVVFHLKSHTYNYSSNDQQTLILPT